MISKASNEPSCEKTGLRGFRPDRKMARGLKLVQLMDCSIYVAKTKALISFAVTAKLICVFVLAYAKSRFSNDAAQILMG